jgi:predicted nucleic-acid-binding protein
VSRLPLARVASTRFFTLGPKLLRGTSPFGFEVNRNVYVAEEGCAADIASVHDHGWNTKQIGGRATEIIERRLTEENPIDVLVLENEQEVFNAMIALKGGQGSFAAATIAALGTRAGCSCTLTFDQKALRLPGFELP